ncbi:hypothetical protein SNE40_012503 [Patella caerulea]
MQKELLALTDKELKLLPEVTEFLESRERVAENYLTKNDYLDKLSCGSESEDVESSTKRDSSNCSDTWIPVDKSLNEFLQSVQSHRLEVLNVVTSLDELEHKLNDFTINRSMYGDSNEFMNSGGRSSAGNEFMNKKKSHEIEIMSSICSGLHNKYKTDLVVDIGSGKGYLGTHLASYHNILVVGIDSSSGNTSGATKRSKLMQKHQKIFSKTSFQGEFPDVQQRQSSDQCKLGTREGRRQRASEVGSQAIESSVQEESQIYNVTSVQGESEVARQQSGFQDQQNCVSKTGDNKLILKETPVTSQRETPPDQNEPPINLHISTESMSTEGVSSPPDNREFSVDLHILTEGVSTKINNLDRSGDIEKFSVLNIEEGAVGKTNANFTSLTNNKKPGKSKHKDSGKRVLNYFPQTFYIDKSTELWDVIRTSLPENISGATGLHLDDKHSHKVPNILLTGLHTCGDLASNIIKIFLKEKSVRVLCYVGCCYHLMKEQFLDFSYLHQRNQDFHQRNQDFYQRNQNFHQRNQDSSETTDLHQQNQNSHQKNQNSSESSVPHQSNPDSFKASVPHQQNQYSSESCNLHQPHQSNQDSSEASDIYQSNQDSSEASDIYQSNQDSSEASDIYQRNQGSSEFGFPLSDTLIKNKCFLGKTALNLAVQSPCRYKKQDSELQGRTFFKRALLQKIVCDLFGEDTEVRGLRNVDKNCASFSDYVRRAFVKLGFPTTNLSEELLSNYFDKYHKEEKKLAAFFQLRAALAPCIETLILLDRFAFLLEQDMLENVYLVRLFDAEVSPRCYGFVAIKK